ncbi:MAG: STAS domain-containing protein [Leptospiraceae bacterium]|nr:STAS domain-containing protein [Leptospiraceae bacterium]MCB1322681.1 STAS domain-containing protein [Leptospiraceae bacterium]
MESDKFTFRREGNRALLGIEGRFTLEDKEDFLSFVSDSIDDQGGVLCIDARQLDYIDSSGIGDLIKLKMEAMKSFKRVCILGLTANMERVFRVSGLNSVFEVIDEAEYNQL